MKKPMQFAVQRADGDQEPSKYGDFRFTIGLPDGRELDVAAEQIDVEDGALLVRSSKEQGTLLSLGPGCWTHWYAASVFDGSPVVVWALDAPKEKS